MKAHESRELAEVFISYAWEDKTSEGVIREAVVEKLCAALARDRFAPMRDVEQIKPGELISTFMDKFGSADTIVAVISDKYLRSRFCMGELYQIRRRYDSQRDVLLEHVVPVILEDVAIDHAAGRKVYVEHWNRVCQEQEKILDSFGGAASEATLREVRLSRQLAHDIDSILAS